MVRLRHSTTVGGISVTRWKSDVFEIGKLTGEAVYSLREATRRLAEMLNRPTHEWRKG
jgi:hypothetical protein